MNSEPGRQCPAPGKQLNPLVTTLPKGTELFRIHPDKYEPDEFNPGTGVSRGRFHPIKDNANSPIPTLYAADSIEGALSETIFHDVTGNGGSIPAYRLNSQVISTLSLTEDVELADLTGHGIRRIGLQRNQLLDCNASVYINTARWAEALHIDNRVIKGLIWVSRQFDTTKAVVFFGDRVAKETLQIVNKPVGLSDGKGRQQVEDFAVLSGIKIIQK